MTLTIRHVDVNYMQQTWPMVKPFIDEAMEKGGEFPDWAAGYNVDHIQGFLTAGQWLLLVAIDEENVIHGAATVSFINYPLHRVAFVTAIGGKLISSQDTFAQLKVILKQRGATKIQGYGRESIVRLWKRYDFEPRNTLVEVLI
jgi:hypothetical protein